MLRKVTGAIILFCFTIAVGYAQHSMSDLYELRDLRASSAEQEMQRMGYRLSSVDKASGRAYQYWYSQRDRRCVQAVIENGRVEAIKQVSTAECKDQGSSGNYFNPVAMRGLTEVKASSRLQDEGYRVVSTDGKGAGRIDMYWYNAKTRRCLKMEVDNDYVRNVNYTTTAMCTNADNRPDELYGKGSKNDTSMDYLKGWPATKAYDRLEDRGYTQKKGHRDDGKTWRVWYNSRTGECIKTLSQNSKISKVIPSSRCN
ncbi:hypothetical protein [Robertkochia sediminum]|uniref:hypothetical protein n=1 Tax=Robertkochia sediminum TaxID=2785326 RepID=UPI0019339881|nr:hypothetical protein [Robertkochia sediminum]MBL7473953.1 hypothetical protein [Robertkochia sediminum]